MFRTAILNRQLDIRKISHIIHDSDGLKLQLDESWMSTKIILCALELSCYGIICMLLHEIIVLKRS